MTHILSFDPFRFRLGVSCPKNHNPADFFIQLLAIVPSQEVCSYETIDTVCEAYETSQYKSDMMEHQKQLSIASRVSRRRNSTKNQNYLLKKKILKKENYNQIVQQNVYKLLMYTLWLIKLNFFFHQNIFSHRKLSSNILLRCNFMK